MYVRYTKDPMELVGDSVLDLVMAQEEKVLLALDDVADRLGTEGEGRALDLVGEALFMDTEENIDEKHYEDLTDEDQEEFRRLARNVVRNRNWYLGCLDMVEFLQRRGMPACKPFTRAFGTPEDFTEAWCFQCGETCRYCAFREGWTLTGTDDWCC